MTDYDYWLTNEADEVDSVEDVLEHEAKKGDMQRDWEQDR